VVRGVRIDGTWLRRLRFEHGYSQKVLATRAGVSERTIRNAEKGLMLEAHVADCIAGAVGVRLGDLVLERATAGRSVQLQRWARKFCRAYFMGLTDQRYDELTAFLHPLVWWSSQSSPAVPFDGIYEGTLGVRELLRRFHTWIDQQELLLRSTLLTRIEGDGDLLYFHVEVVLMSTCLEGESRPTWLSFVCSFEDDRIQRVNQYFGLQTGSEPATNRPAIGSPL